MLMSSSNAKGDCDGEDERRRTADRPAVTPNPEPERNVKTTSIEWTDLSSNPLQYRNAAGNVVWGCVKKSSGCAHCYAESIANHYDRGGPFTRATMATLTPFLDEKELKHILTAKVIDKRPVAGLRCFLGDMTDVFGDWVSDELLDKLFAVMGLRSDVTFQVLTKRPDRMARYYADGHRNGRGTHTSIFIAREMGRLAEQHGISAMKLDEVNGLGGYFPPNVWLGTSVENQAAADERIPHLLHTPAAVRFLSCEPLLGPVDLRPKAPEAYSLLGRFYSTGTFDPTGMSPAPDRVLNCFPKIGWAIVGGESGHGSRPMHVEWARSFVAQCQAANCPVFVKQLGSVPTVAGDSPDGRVSLPLANRKGNLLEDFPADLRIREFPTVPS